MNFKDIATHLGTIVLAIIAALFVYLGKMPWYVGILIAAAALQPSSLPAIINALKGTFSAAPALVALVFFTIVACGPAGNQPAPQSARPCAGLNVDECGAKYQAELAICSAQAKTLSNSLACEDAAREAYGRPPRAGMHDAGAADAAQEGGAR